MNKNTTAKVLKRMGIVLVAMPEPFTTPVGLACIVTAQCLSNSIKKARLAMIQKKKHNNFPEDFVYPNEVNRNNCYTRNRIDFYSYDRSKRYHIPVHYKYNYSAKAEPRPVPVIPEKIQTVEKYLVPDMKKLALMKADEFVRARTSEAADTRVSSKMIPHRVDLNALSRRYQNIQASETKADAEEAVPCPVNMQLLKQQRALEKIEKNKVEQAPKTEIRSRNIDVETLVKRYNKAPNTATPQIRNSSSFGPSYRLAMGC
jgi:hypothetical protein